MTSMTPATTASTIPNTSSPTHTTSLRLWVLPWGLYPRRLTIYLREKQLGPDVIEVIPVHIDLSTAKLAASPGRPEGTLPILEVRRPSKEGAGDGEYVMQSTAILEYLEDLTAGSNPDSETVGQGISALSGALAKTKNMRGRTAFERSQVRQALQVLDEATAMFGVYVHEASKLFAGLTEMEQSDEASVRAWEKTKKLLDLLEGMAAKSEGPWLAWEEGKVEKERGPSIADCVLVSTVQFAQRVYAVDLVAGTERLGRVVKAFEERGTAKLGFGEEVPEMVAKFGPELSVRF
jgi:glutathione S-transferase